MGAAEAVSLDDALGAAAPALPAEPVARVAPEAPAPEAAPRPDRRRQLPPRPAVPPPVSPPSAWVAALRLGSLPTALLGVVVGGLAVARDPASRPGLLVLVVVAVVAAHALAALARCLGDPRPRRAGPLRRAEAGRTALALTASLLLLTGSLVLLRDPRALVLAGVGLAAALLAVSRRSGPVALAAAGALAGGGTALLATWAATGSLGGPQLLAGLPAAAVVAGLLAGRRSAVRGAAARVLVVAPYAAVGAAVALTALPWPALAVALALPAARTAGTAAGRPDAGAVVAGHARLAAVLLAAGLLAAALTGAA
jgi:hypothetical protein